MASITKGAQRVGTLTIKGKSHDLLQINRAIWIIDPVTDRSVGRNFRSKESLRDRYPSARFG